MSRSWLASLSALGLVTAFSAPAMAECEVQTNNTVINVVCEDLEDDGVEHDNGDARVEVDINVSASARVQTIQNTPSKAVLEKFPRRHRDRIFAPDAKAGLNDRLAEKAVADGGPAERPSASVASTASCDGVEVHLGTGGTRCIRPGSGESFRDCADCPEMVVVPAGEFMMGSPDDEEGRFYYEGPQHKVTIPQAFAVGKFEVKFAEWDACVADGGCKHKPYDQEWGRGDRPVIDVSWDDITKEYLPWLSRKTGQTYRLLTEAEWEYAARGGTQTRYFFGDSESQLGDHSWYDLNSGGKTHSVGQKKANPWGLYQVHGNVWEWVRDCWNESYEGAPNDGSAWASGDCDQRILRGGSWYVVPQGLRSAYRYGSYSDFRGYRIGFRLSRTLNPES